MHAQNKFISFIGLGSRTAGPILYQYLSLHPALVTPESPTNYFSNAKVYAKGIAWYHGNFIETKEGFMRAELGLDYLSHAQSAGLIAKTYPSAKLLAVVENPLVSVRIEYVEAIRANLISRRVSLAEFLKDHPEVLLRARYGRQLVNYFSLYSPNDLMILIARDLREEPLKALYKVYEHVGLDSSFVPLALRHLVVVEEDEKHRPGFIKRGFLLIRKGVKFLFHKIKTSIKPVKKVEISVAELGRKVNLSPELRQFLTDYFKADVKQLSSLLHRDLSSEWGFDKS